MLNSHARRNKRHSQKGGNIFKKIAKVGKRFADRYGDMAKAVGVDKVAKTTGKNVIKKKIPTFESRLKKAGVSEKVLKPIVNEVNKQLGEGVMKYHSQTGDGMIKDALIRLAALITGRDPYVFTAKERREHEEFMREEDERLERQRREYDRKKRQEEREYQKNLKERGQRARERFGFGYNEMEGGSFWDTLVDIVSVLPIPIVSDAARTIKMVKTAVSTAKGEEPVKAFGGVISDVVDAVDQVMPAPLKEFTTTPAKQYSELYGYGAVSPDDRTKIVKVGLQHLDDTLGLVKLDKIPRKKALQIMTAQRKIKQALPEINKIKVGGAFGVWKPPQLPKNYDIISKKEVDKIRKLEEKRLKEKRLKNGGSFGSWKPPQLPKSYDITSKKEVDKIRKLEEKRLKEKRLKGGLWYIGPHRSDIRGGGSFGKLEEKRLKAAAERKAIFDRMHF
jgi:hypothetical protein